MEKYLEGEEEFLANYSDGLTDLPLPQQLEHFHQQDKVASFLCVRPNLSYHLVSLRGGQRQPGVRDPCHRQRQTCASMAAFSSSRKKSSTTCGTRKNWSIEPFHRLVQEKQLMGYSYDGFWASMDTFKDRQQLESLYSTGGRPLGSVEDQWHAAKQQRMPWPELSCCR